MTLPTNDYPHFEARLEWLSQAQMLHCGIQATMLSQQQVTKIHKGLFDCTTPTGALLAGTVDLHEGWHQSITINHRNTLCLVLDPVWKPLFPAGMKLSDWYRAQSSFDAQKSLTRGLKLKAPHLIKELCVRDFPKDMDRDQLSQLFHPATVGHFDQEKRLAFVKFETARAASKAIDKLQTQMRVEPARRAICRAEFKMSRLSDKNASEYMFTRTVDETEEEISVRDYYDQIGLHLELPELPVVLTPGSRGGEAAYPMELLVFCPGQAYRKLPSKLQGEVVTRTAITAKHRESKTRELLQTIKEMEALGDEFQDSWGVALTDIQTEVTAYMLPPPKLLYGSFNQLPEQFETMSTDRGVWNMKGKSWYERRKLENWAVIDFSTMPSPDRAVETLVRDFEHAVRGKQVSAIKWGSPPLPNKTPTVAWDCLDQFQERHRRGLELLVCIWAKKDYDPSQPPPCVLRHRESEVRVVHIVLPEVGSWYDTKQWHRAVRAVDTPPHDWAVVCFADEHTVTSAAASAAASDAVQQLRENMARSGLHSSTPLGACGTTCNQSDPHSICSLLDSVAHRATNERGDRPYIVCLLPDDNPMLYDSIKYAAHVLVPERNEQRTLPVQCLVKPKLKSKARDPGYAANIAAKMNLHLGGVNCILETPAIPTQRLLVVGVHMYQATGQPAIAAVLGSSDQYLNHYSNVMSVQENDTEFHIKKLKESLCTLLERYYQQCKQTPTEILLYRDSVPDGEVAGVKALELGMINAALSASGIHDTCQITYILVSKDHRRIFPQAYADNRTGNSTAGLVADQGVCHPTRMQFRLQPHTTTKGTPQMRCYSILETQHSLEKLVTMTFHLCFLFGRCTRSVSSVPPLYYAIDAAKRFAGYLHQGAQPESCRCLGNDMFYL